MKIYAAYMYLMNYTCIMGACAVLSDRKLYYNVISQLHTLDNMACVILSTTVISQLHTPDSMMCVILSTTVEINFD